MKKLGVLSYWVVAVLLSPAVSFATTLVDIGVAGNAGFWFGDYNKGYVFINNEERAVPITGVSALDRGVFGGSTPDSVYMNWMTAPGPNTAREVTSATINFYRAGQLLLGLTPVAGESQISMTPALGAAGDFQLNGLFTATSGLFKDRLTDLLTVALRYNSGIVYKNNDFHFTQGDLLITHAPRPPGEEVPEPASLALLVTGLAGLTRARRAKA